MSPRLELVASHNVLLALPGSEYVAYFPRGGTNHVKLVAGDLPGGMVASRDRPVLRTAAPHRGRWQRGVCAAGSHPNDDWILHLRRNVF